MVDFSVAGPFEIPVYEGRKGRIVRTEEGDRFFDAHSRYKRQRGCYVFAMRAGRGITPTYVGKATKCFGQECFTAHKLGKCNQTLVDYLRGTLVLFFVAPTGAGRPPNKQIGLLENFLIQTAVAKNPDLLNVQGTKQESWAIKGVIRSGRGHATASSQKFREAMGIE